MNNCGIFPPQGDVCFHTEIEDCPCLRSQGHDGPHLAFVLPRHCYCLWETDWECGCSYCQSEDPSNWCIIYQEITIIEAGPYLTDA